MLSATFNCYGISMFRCSSTFLQSQKDLPIGISVSISITVPRFSLSRGFGLRFGISASLAPPSSSVSVSTVSVSTISVSAAVVSPRIGFGIRIGFGFGYSFGIGGCFGSGFRFGTPLAIMVSTAAIVSTSVSVSIASSVVGVGFGQSNAQKSGKNKLAKKRPKLKLGNSISKIIFEVLTNDFMVKEIFLSEDHSQE